MTVETYYYVRWQDLNASYDWGEEFDEVCFSTLVEAEKKYEELNNKEDILWATLYSEQVLRSFDNED